jgi:OOP family OmpA-OmpF porin
MGRQRTTSIQIIKQVIKTGHQKETFMKKILVSFLLLTSPWVFAQGDNVNSTDRDMSMQGRAGTIYGVAPYIGLSAGFAPQNQDVNVEGADSSIKLLGSMYPGNGRSVFDVGFGTMNQQFSSNRAAEHSVNSGVLELAGRYQFANRWQAGLVANTMFDKGQYFGANQADAQFGGLQVIREISLQKGILARVGARAMQELNISNENVYIGMIDFQFGWFPSNRQGVAQNNDNTSGAGSQVTGATTPAVSNVDTNAVPAAVPVAELDLKDVGGEHSVVIFESNSSDLKSSEVNKANALGDTLAQNDGLFDRIELIGYADHTGSDQTNQELSQERANTLQGILKEKGVPAEKISAIGRGSADPVNEGNSPDELRMNRRVEIKMYGVKDRDQLDHAFQTQD